MRTAPNHAGPLTLDLWGRVLSFAVASVADESNMGVLPPSLCFKEQAEFYRLRLVCKAFNQAFLDYPHLSRGLILQHPLGSISSLMAWLQRYHGSVQTFAGFESPIVEVVLFSLLRRPSALRTVFLQPCKLPGCRLDLRCLQGCETLTTLEIAVLVDDILDLSKLSIPHLQTMVLQNGYYHSAQLPEKLSSLTLAEATLVCQPADACATALKKLKLSDSRLEGLHTRGVVGCCALEGLTCLESLIVTNLNDAASDATDLCCTWPVQLPAKISALTNLTSLDVTVSTSSGLRLDAFYGCRSLHDLSVHSCGAQMLVSNGLQALTRLTSLTLLASDRHNKKSICLHTDWDGMVSLQVLDISCGVFDFYPSLVGLVGLPSLRAVNIVNSFPLDEMSAEVFAALIGLLAKESNAEFRINGRNAQQIRSRHTRRIVQL